MVSIVFYSGGPASPVPMLRMISSTLLLLEWNVPFTWPYTTILHYSLSFNDSMEGWNQDLITNTSVEIRARGELSPCTAITFSVSASNEIAEGQYGNVTGGFPIVGVW